MRHPLAHAEALANAILGIALSQLVLFAFGVEFTQAIALNAVMFGVSYGRSFALRRLFGRLSVSDLPQLHWATTMARAGMVGFKRLGYRILWATLIGLALLFFVIMPLLMVSFSLITTISDQHSSSTH